MLKSLHLLTLLSGDKDISITREESLRPDLACINQELESVVLFELKKSGQTGRQALTELLAYEQEIKNHLPLLSNYDFNFVLVSPEWTTLMDHAVSSAIAWSNRKILCLIPSLKGNELRLETHIPVAWKVTGSVYFPPEAMPCVTVCLYNKNAYDVAVAEARSEGREEETAESELEKLDRADEGDQLDSRIWTALEVIAREGDRLGSHGFALLWRDHHPASLTDYNITVCGVSPFAFYQASRLRGTIGTDDGRLVASLDKYVREHAPAGHSEALMAAATVAYPLLNEVADPSLEGFSSWEGDRHTLRRRAIPLLCEFWGVLGDYARSYVMNPAVRTHRRGTLQNGLSDWRDPRVGLPLIQSFTKPEIFFEGEVRCSDAFRLGLLFGLDRTFRMNIRRRDHPGLRCRFIWNRIELMTALDEMRLLADAAQNVSPPDSPFKFYEDPLVDDEDESSRALAWILSEFFQDSPSHRLFFSIGMNGCLIFDERKQGLGGEPIPEGWIRAIENDLRCAIGLVLSLYKQLEAEGGLWGDQPIHFRQLRSMLGLRKKFALARLADIQATQLLDAWNCCLEASESVLETVFHRHAPISFSTVDWPWLQQGIAEMRQRGEHDAGVILLPSGHLVTGRVLPSGAKVNLLMDPDEEVPFLDRSHGFGLMRIVNWSELISGEAFRDGR